MKGSRKGAKTTDVEDLCGAVSWQPSDWFSTLENIQYMRRNEDAPVDKMGCDMLANKQADPKTYRLQILLGLMLSSQTKDELTSSTMAKLIESGVANVKALKEIHESELADMLHPVSFYRTKAKNIKKVAKILDENFGGDIPRSVKELMDLPGVGPKMAHLAMKVAWNEITGIGVDTHVHRIANRLHWVPHPTKSPEETRIYLESWLPRDIWADVNKLLVGFGQQTCLPARPRCESCRNAPICPTAPRYLTSKKSTTTAAKSTSDSNKRSATSPIEIVDEPEDNNNDDESVMIVYEKIKRKSR
ncbi:unnamed protein product [Hymenolepis diminuta]|uniref:Endonuclease III homolog n=1 Tax=Hymenolepis diminuta TaxID=6216 RepID=A0A0R3SBG3_HYMDI|nr:unnamed protein product [Hymenolepis diminuta]VUZ39165.1 unnamed protein product [Hymenolepis diminuta]